MSPIRLRLASTVDTSAPPISMPTLKAISRTVTIHTSVPKVRATMSGVINEGATVRRKMIAKTTRSQRTIGCRQI